MSKIKRRTGLIVLFIVFLSAAGIGGYFWWHGRHAPPHYVTQAVTSGAIERSVTMTGTVEPLGTVQVGSYVSGIVKEVKCDYNTEVKVRQVCARIDPAPFQLVVEQDKADANTTEAQIRKDQAALTYARLTFDRDSKLLADGVVSADTVDSDHNVLSQAEAQIAFDQATLIEKRAILHAAEVNLAYTDILSPVDGVVITKNVDVGQTVVSNLQSATLFLIAKDLTRMQVEANVAEADIAAVKVGQKARFTVQAFEDKSFEGVVTQIRQAPITVQSVVTYDVVVSVDNPDKALLPGMTADTHIITAMRDNVLRVPLAALRFMPVGTDRRRPEGGFRGGNGERRAAAGAAGEGQAQPGGERRQRPDGERRGPPNGERRGGQDGERRAPPEGQRRAFSRGQVWVLRDDALTAVPVRVGLDDGTLVEVSGDGLHPGDLVVVSQMQGDEQPQAQRRPTNGQNQQRRPQGLGGLRF